MAKKRASSKKTSTKAISPQANVAAAAFDAAPIPTVTTTGPKSSEFEYEFAVIIQQITYEQSGDFSIDLRFDNTEGAWTISIQRTSGYNTKVVLPSTWNQEQAETFCSKLIAELSKVLATDATTTIRVGLNNDESFSQLIISRGA